MFLYTTNRRDTNSISGGLSFFERAPKVRITYAFAMVFLVKWGFDEVSKKAKIIEIKRCVTTFTCLRRCRGDFKEGV